MKELLRKKLPGKKQEEFKLSDTLLWRIQFQCRSTYILISTSNQTCEEVNKLIEASLESAAPKEAIIGHRNVEQLLSQA